MDLGFGFLPKEKLCLALLGNDVRLLLVASFVLALMQVGILNPHLLCDPVPRLHLSWSEPSNATSGHCTFEILENYGHLVP